VLSIEYRECAPGLRSRIILLLMRVLMRPLVGWLFGGKPQRIAKAQLQVSSMQCPDSAGLSIDYRLVGRAPGHVIGELDDPARAVILWLHGGGFAMPAAPAQHLPLVARLCRALDAAGFLPDYRLAPQNPHPAALDDCERAYREVLDRGFAPDSILLGGDSAGGNLVLGLLQRIRGAGLPMPACAVLLSPATEMGRGHTPPSRHRLMRRDPLLATGSLTGLLAAYVGSRDTADPELSPLYMDCHGLPPLYFLASSNEILMDDSIFMARRTAEAGIPTRCHIWSHYPHAFPLFENYFPEVAPVREDIVAFARQHLRLSQLVPEPQHPESGVLSHGSPVRA